MDLIWSHHKDCHCEALDVQVRTCFYVRVTAQVRNIMSHSHTTVSRPEVTHYRDNDGGCCLVAMVRLSVSVGGLGLSPLLNSCSLHSCCAVHLFNVEAGCFSPPVTTKWIRETFLVRSLFRLHHIILYVFRPLSGRPVPSGSCCPKSYIPQNEGGALLCSTSDFSRCK